VQLGGEITATAGTPADRTFFNYTDYERNVLRTFRAAVTAMWQPADRLAFLADIRADDAEDVTASAAYVRIRPWRDRPLDVQAGRIPPVFGAFGRRAYQADRTLIGYPLAYQYLTSLRSDALPAGADDLLRMRGRGWRSSFPVGSPYAGPGLPLISAFKWDTGLQARWLAPRLEAALALTNGTISNPRLGDDNGGKQLAARMAVTPATGLVLGASAARGGWIAREVPGAARTHAQTGFGADAEYSRGYGMLRAEMVWSRWDVPFVSPPPEGRHVTALAGWIEGRYRVSPRIYLAARADRLGFSRISSAATAGPLPWDAPMHRYELGAGYSLQRNVILRGSLQFNQRDGDRRERRTFLATQVTWWF
jgi:hypothetical protein